MLPFDLPPPIPIHCPAPESRHEGHLLFAKEGGKANVSMYEQQFNRALADFNQRLQKLSPQHKAEIRKIHQQVNDWADKARAQGQRADKLSTFVGKVMNYADGHLANIEKADPELRQFKSEHKQFQDLFLSGNGVIEAYLSWVREDYRPKPKSPPAKPQNKG